MVCQILKNLQDKTKIWNKYLLKENVVFNRKTQIALKKSYISLDLW